MIGSATQIIPTIINEVRHLTQFIRTPQYYLEQKNPKISPSLKFLFRYVPGFHTIFRCAIFILVESTFGQFKLNRSGEDGRFRTRHQSQTYIKTSAPKEFWPLLLPEHTVGCKRRIFDEGYIPALQRPNIHLTNDPIERLTATGVITQSGAYYACDVLIAANGFSAKHFTLPTRGRHGITQPEHWSEFGGIEAYKSTALADFPNFFMVYGPNAGAGHMSAIYRIECTVDLIIQKIRPLIKDHVADEVEVKLSAERTWVRDLQAALRHRVWATSCGAYYMDPKNKWNIAMYPHSSYHLWFVNRFAKSSDWRYTPSLGNVKTTYGALTMCLASLFLLAIIAVVCLQRRHKLAFMYP